MLLKQHLLHFFGTLVLIQYCAEVTGDDDGDGEDKGRAALSTMMTQGGKNRKHGSHSRPRQRPCKRPPPPPPSKKGGANKTNDDSEQARFFPGKYGWDIKKFPSHLRPQEPCYEEPDKSGDGPSVDEPDRTSKSHKEALAAWEEARCKDLLDSVKNRSQRPKPGEKHYPQMWGWDIGKVVQTKELSPSKRMRENNLRYAINRCKRRKNKNKNSKPAREWIAPNYGGGGLDPGFTRPGLGVELDPGFSRPDLARPVELDPGFSRPDLARPVELDPGFIPPAIRRRSKDKNAKPPYVIPSTLPAESYSDGGTAHAGKEGALENTNVPGLGKPPLRFLPWAEIFGYRPAKHDNSGLKVDSMSG